MLQKRHGPEWLERNLERQPDVVSVRVASL